MQVIMMPNVTVVHWVYFRICCLSGRKDFLFLSLQAHGLYLLENTLDVNALTLPFHKPKGANKAGGLVGGVVLPLKTGVWRGL